MNLPVRFFQALLRCGFKAYLLYSGSQYKTFLTKKDIDPRFGYIIAANHQRKFDPFVIGAALPRSVNKRLAPMRFMGYYKFFDFWLRRWFLRAAGTFPTHETRGLPYGLPYATHILQNKGTVCIFPEGRRTAPRATEPKWGVKVLAELPDVKLIPVHLQWHKRRFGERVEIVIGTPVSAAGMTPAEIMDMVYSL